MAKKEEAKVLEVMNIELVEVPLTIIGTTPLIVHAWSEKAKREMLEKQMGVAKARKHAIKVPNNDFINSLNWLTEKPEDGADNEEAINNFNEAVKKGAAWGFHIGGIKQSFITGAARSGMDVKMTELRGAFFLRGNKILFLAKRYKFTVFALYISFFLLFIYCIHSTCLF